MAAIYINTLYRLTPVSKPKSFGGSLGEGLQRTGMTCADRADVMGDIFWNNGQWIEESGRCAPLWQAYGPTPRNQGDIL